MRRTSGWPQAFRQAAILVLLAVAAAVAAHHWHPLAPAWYAVEAPLLDDEVTVEHVREVFGGDVLWLDARHGELFEAGHIPGARLLNEQDFDGQLFDLIEVLQINRLPVVIYCNGEKCEASRKVKQRLVESLPLENIWILKGGLPAWKNAGGEIVTPPAG